MQAGGRKKHHSSSRLKKFRHHLSFRALHTLGMIALNLACEKPARKIVGELTRRIMLRHQLVGLKASLPSSTRLIPFLKPCHELHCDLIPGPQKTGHRFFIRSENRSPNQPFNRSTD